VSADPLRTGTRLGGVLVTDLVQSTRLRASLGDARAEPLRRAHERMLHAVVARHSGHVERWLGDGILATFESVSSAARAAIDVQQANARQSRSRLAGLALQVRAGFAGGELLWSDGDCGGAAVADATEACEAAAPDEILAPSSVFELIGSREVLRRREAGGDRIAVLWDPPGSAAHSLGVPLTLRTSGQLPFIGRARAMSALREAFQRAARGEPQFVAIRGDAGIGKTRLVAELCQEVDVLGGAIVYAAAQDGSAAPYDPLDKALRHWIARVDDLAARLGPTSGELARLAPELLERVPDLPAPPQSEPEVERRRLHDAFAEWLNAAALDDAFVLVLDSLHWASEAAFDLLRRSLGSLAGSRVAVVTTQRPSDPRTGALVQAAADAFGAGAARVIELGGLDEAEVEALVRRVQDDASPALCGALHVVTRGNPLHLNELLRAGTREADLPTTVRAALRETTRALPPDMYRALEAASVIGESFEASLLADVIGDSRAAFDALERAARDGLIRELDRERLVYGFSHALMQKAFYDEVSGARASLLHERVGLALERRRGLRGADAAALAHHFGVAAPLGHLARAARYAAAAGRHALAQYANAQALAWFREARRRSEELPIDGERCRLAIDTGEALRRLGDPSYRAELIAAAELAAELRDGQAMASALLATYRGTFSRAMHVDAAQVARLRAALGQIGEGDDALRARLLALLGTELTWAPDGAEGDAASAEALAIARRLGDRDLLADVLAQRQWSVFHPLEDRLAITRELRDLVAKSSRLALRFDATGSALFTASRAGDRVLAEQALGELRELASQIDQPHAHWMYSIRASTAALSDGRFDEARALAEGGFALAKRSGMPDADAQRLVQRFWLGAESLPADDERLLLRRMVPKHRELLPFNWPVLAFRCAELGLTQERDLLLTSIRPGLAHLRRGQTWLMMLCGAAAAAADAGDSALCEWLLAELEPHACEHANFVFGTMGSVARYLGLLAAALGRGDEAERWFAEAAARDGAFGNVTWRVRALLDLAAFCFAREGSAHAAARSALAEALAVSERLGLPALGERARRLAAAWPAT
jgi:hypothetical protein